MKNNEKILFLISKEIGLSLLKSFLREDLGEVLVTVITLDDSNDSRSNLNEIIKYCESKKLDLEVVINNSEFTKILKDKDFTSIFVCGWYWMLSNSIITKVKGRVFGIHHSILPKYRGFSPLVWSMIAGDETVGSTLFKINNELDAGEIYYQWKIRTKGRVIKEILNDLDSLITANFGEVLIEVLNGNNQGEKQDDDKAIYCARRTSDSGHINWKDSAKNVLNFINAQSDPYPGAFFYKNDKKYIIDSAEMFNFHVMGIPGQVVMYTEIGVVVCCGDYKGILIKNIRNISLLKSILSSLDMVLK